MAITYHVDGPAQIKVGTGVSGALEVLGYTRDGAEIRLEGFFEEVKSDDTGGEQGPPGDLNYLGEQAVIRLELVKYDGTVADKVMPRIKGQTPPGTPASPGQLMLQDSKAIRLLIQPSGTGAVPWNFPAGIVYGAIEVNKGTRHSRLVMEWRALKDSSGVLFNNVTT